MWKMSCYCIGVAIGSLAAVHAFFACFARIEGAGELDYLLDLDRVIGGLFATAFLLLVAPSLPGASAKWYGASAIAAVVIWAAVSGPLIREHEEQFRIRSAAAFATVELSPSSP